MSAGEWLRRHGLAAVLWALYAVMWIGGTGGHLLFGGTPREMAWTAPAFLLLASLLAIVSAPDQHVALGISFLIGLGIEVIGVATGYPFGRYTYTNVLAPEFLGVPVVVGGAWMVLIAWVRQLRLPVTMGALAMTACDLVIDPLAAGPLGFWHWSAGGRYFGVPAMNFAGWFLVSLGILSLLGRPAARNAGVFAVGSSILIFFALIGLSHAFFVPASLAVLVSGAGYWRWSSSSVSTRI